LSQPLQTEETTEKGLIHATVIGRKQIKQKQEEPCGGAEPDGNAGELDDADVAVDPAGVLGHVDVPDRRADDPVDGLEVCGKDATGMLSKQAVEPVAAAELALLLVEAAPDVLHAHAQLRLGAPRPRARLRLLPRMHRLHGSPSFLLYRSIYHTDVSLFSTSTSALLFFLVSVHFNAVTPCFVFAAQREGGPAGASQPGS
jgi:hypothetical protein